MTTGDVQQTDDCRHCRRPIALVEGIGWLHEELPKYAHEPITCERAEPSTREAQ